MNRKQQLAKCIISINMSNRYLRVYLITMSYEAYKTHGPFPEYILGVNIVPSMYVNSSRNSATAYCRRVL